MCPGQPCALAGHQAVGRRRQKGGQHAKQGGEKERRRQQSQRYTVSWSQFYQKPSLGGGYSITVVGTPFPDPYRSEIMTEGLW